MKRHDIINLLIRSKNYTRYLEIGVDNPANNFDKINIPVSKSGLRWSDTPRDGLRKEGVDPAGRCTHKMTSDAFFEENYLKTPPVTWDIIFIDGLHTGEQVMKDIHNSLMYLSPGGTIVVHDCNPPTEWHTRPYEQFKFDRSPWNGTTYKGFVTYKQHNPLLEMFTVQTDWGCGIIRHPHPFEPTLPSEITVTWEDFRDNREKYLNLITPEEFKLQCQPPKSSMFAKMKEWMRAFAD